MATSIEFDYSAVLGKHTVRTKGICLSGRGITQHHSEDDAGLYNVYSMTKTAFQKVCDAHPEMTPAI